MDCIALRHTHTTSLRCHPHVPTFEPCRIMDVLPPGRNPAGLPISKPFLIPTSDRPAKLAAVEACKAMDLRLWTNQVLRKSSQRLLLYPRTEAVKHTRHDTC